MNYTEFRELCKAKNIKISDVCEYVGMTRPGLVKSLDNETIELRKLKLLCDYVRISPAQFFDTGIFGSLQNNSVFESHKIEEYEKEIEYLKNTLKDKEEIINLMREKDSGYRIASERKTKYELSKKKEYERK
ncbi:MAG: helix-turn-helix domain-containing protein [Bacteroidales bacterium]|nr:helix-turn-helix domain-containing protein [Bacteroidales bacterium]